MLPKATALVSPLNTTARQRRLQQPGLPGAPRHDIINLEGDTDAQQKRKRDDIGEVDRQSP